MTIIKPAYRINRRHFVSGAMTLGAAGALKPLASLAKTGRLKILWTGAAIMGSTGMEGDLEAQFPNVLPILEEQAKNVELYQMLGKIPGAGEHSGYGRLSVNNGDISWFTGSSKKETHDLSMILGITSDRDIASKFYETDDKTVLVYEIQSYLLLYDYVSSQVTQTFPVRLLRLAQISGKKTPKTIRKKMWADMSGKSREGGLRQEIFETLKRMKFRRAENFSVRVTKAEILDDTLKFLHKQTPAIPFEEFRDSIKHSMTTSISQELGISVQPPFPDGSLGRIVEDVEAAQDIQGGARGAKLIDVFELRKPDVRIELVMGGILTDRRKVKGLKDSFSFVIESGVELNVSYQGRKIFSKWIVATVEEITTGTWRSEYYEALDLHQRLFDWFFAGLYKGSGYENMTRGLSTQGRNKRWRTEVIHEGKHADFVSSMQTLRKILLKT